MVVMASPYPPSNINETFESALNESARIDIWEKLFVQPTGPKSSCTKLDRAAVPYFIHLYNDELLRLKSGLSPEARQAENIAITTHKEVFDVVEVIEKHKDKPKSQSISQLKLQYPQATTEQLNNAIDLALRVALLVNARFYGTQGSDPRSPPLQWRESQTLEQFFEYVFPPSSWQPQGKESLTRLNNRFTAAFMVEVCGLELTYTASLQDHLRLDRIGKRNVLRIFPFKACLNALNTRPGHPIIPRKVLQEAIRTLDLLFPSWDPATEETLRKQTKTLPVKHQILFIDVEPVGGPRSLNVFDYDIWRDRLLELYEDVYQSPPASWAQLWKDDRNPQQFWTFWIALFILGLTILSTAATGVQTVYSILAYYK